MTGGVRAPSHSPGHTLWALHADVKKWIAIRTGLDQTTANNELAARRKIIRARNEPCRLIILDDNTRPPT